MFSPAYNLLSIFSADIHIYKGFQTFSRHRTVVDDTTLVFFVLLENILYTACSVQIIYVSYLTFPWIIHFDGRWGYKRNKYIEKLLCVCGIKGDENALSRYARFLFTIYIAFCLKLHPLAVVMGHKNDLMIALYNNDTLISTEDFFFEENIFMYIVCRLYTVNSTSTGFCLLFL